MKLEFGAVAKGFESENLKPLQFEQLLLLKFAEFVWPRATRPRDCRYCDGTRDVASSAGLINWIPPTHRSGERRPGWIRRGTNYSHCNGQIMPGSRTKTLYLVWPYARPRQIEHTMQHLSANRVRE